MFVEIIRNPSPVVDAGQSWYDVIRVEMMQNVLHHSVSNAVYLEITNSNLEDVEKLFNDPTHARVTVESHPNGIFIYATVTILDVSRCQSSRAIADLGGEDGKIPLAAIRAGTTSLFGNL